MLLLTPYFFFLVVMISPSLSFFQSLFPNSGTQKMSILKGYDSLRKGRDRLKSEILTLARSVDRGLTETNEQRNEMLTLFSSLENVNPTKKPLQSPLVNDVWELEYTTSDSILGRGDFPRVGPILQKIDTMSLSAENSETVSYWGLPVKRKVTAVLTPENDRLTNVQFKRFSIGPFSFNAPKSFKGSLEVTYLDEDLRLSRGDKGNIFVLTRRGDSSI